VTPLDDPAAPPDDRDSDRVVLALLASGMTDEAAASEMRVSVRTFRRRVARAMRSLGAASRFQAGVMARAADIV
jgi:DNA-binding NarL/FixJ family response regulator